MTAHRKSTLLLNAAIRGIRVSPYPPHILIHLVTYNRCQHIKLPFSVLNENPLDSLTLPKLLEIPERIFDEQRQSFYKSIPASATSATANPSSTAAPKESVKSKGSRLFSFSPTRAFSFSSSSSKDQEGDTVMSPVDDYSSEEQDAKRSKSDRGSMDDIPADELNTK